MPHAPRAAAWRLIGVLLCALLSADTGALLRPSPPGAVPAGPKSSALDFLPRDRPPLQKAAEFLGLNTQTFESRGEGSEWTMPLRGGSDANQNPNPTSQNDHGPGQVASHRTAWPQQAVKRSYRRAYFRARRDGWTFYRGQLLTMPQLGRQLRHHADSGITWPKTMPPLPGTRTKRAAVFTWNAGGLGTEIYQDLVAWLHTQKVDIAMIQGTRWTGEATWRSNGYSVIKSGEDPGKSAVHTGLLVFISERVCTFEDISYSPIDPGRILHVKCKTGHNSIDLINLYQHPDAISSTRLRPMDARGAVWNKLDCLLHRLAKRNLWILAGDFNCPVVTASTTTGSVPADAYDLQEILKKYHLGSVRCHDSSPTYIGPTGSSSIDHIYMPKAQLDAHSRMGRSLALFPVASWRATRDHVPVVCSVSLGWKCWFRKPPISQNLSKAAKNALHSTWQTQSPEWRHMQDALTVQIQDTKPCLTQLSQLNTQVLSCCNQMMKAREHMLAPWSANSPWLGHYIKRTCQLRHLNAGNRPRVHSWSPHTSELGKQTEKENTFGYVSTGPRCCWWWPTMCTLRSRTKDHAHPETSHRRWLLQILWPQQRSWWTCAQHLAMAPGPSTGSYLRWHLRIPRDDRYTGRLLRALRPAHATLWCIDPAHPERSCCSIWRSFGSAWRPFDILAESRQMPLSSEGPPPDLPQLPDPPSDPAASTPWLLTIDQTANTHTCSVREPLGWCRVVCATY